MGSDAAIEVQGVSHRYGSRTAIDDLSLEIRPGEVFIFLGPNGSGKTSLFRILSTLIPLQEGEIRILGHDLRTATASIRNSLGIVFQAPSLDKKLTVRENLHYQGRLYGITGRALTDRASEMLSALGLADRASDVAEKLSGGMRRRVELAKALLHRPRMLILDEPSTGLDPGARSDLWKYLEQIRNRDGVTIVLTTHLLEEAERADRIAILHHGKLAALDTPVALQASVGGDSITIRAEQPGKLAERIRADFGCEVLVLGNNVRLEQPDGHQWISRLVEAYPTEIQQITLGKPTLEDVFIDRTGHRFWQSTNHDN